MAAIIDDPLSVVEANSSFAFRFSEISDRLDNNPWSAELLW